MRDLGKTDGLGKVPLGAPTHRDLLAAGRQQVTRNPVAGLPLAPLDDDRAIGFQVADIGPVLGVDVVDDLGIGEVAVESKVTWDGLADDPIDQLDAEVGVRLKRRLLGLAIFALAKAAEVQWIVLATRMDVVRE